jgi:hypothetical protein
MASTSYSFSVVRRPRDVIVSIGALRRSTSATLSRLNVA